MTVKAMDRGHLVELNDVDADGRTCAYCGKKPTSEGHDACLGIIPGVSEACCGHGIEIPFMKMSEWSVKTRWFEADCKWLGKQVRVGMPFLPSLHIEFDSDFFCWFPFIWRLPLTTPEQAVYYGHWKSWSISWLWWELFFTWDAM